jgi:hypothetical protein
MEPSTRSEELEGARLPVSEDTPGPDQLPTERHLVGAGRVAASRDGGRADQARAPVRPSLITSIREQCAACGAAMAPDQRYCVECGQRRGPARVPMLDGFAARSAQADSTRRPPRRPRLSPNSALIAGVGTLLLALGVGVLIGRSGNNLSAKAPPAQIVTIPGGGGTAGTAATGESPQQSASSVSRAAKSSGAAAASAPKARAKGAPLKALKVGSPGKGPGYQGGHFTGNFFGPESEGK